MTRAYRRRHFLVDRFQYRLLAVSIAHLVAFGLLLAAALFLPSMMRLQDTTLTIAERGRAAEEFLVLDRRFWPGVLAFVVLIGAHSVLVSHRIAGPLVGFRRVWSAVGAGDLSVRARIRRHDYLHKDAESINAMISGLNGRVREVQEEVGQICAAWGELRASLSEVSSGEAARRLEPFAARVEALRDRMDRFKTAA